MTAALAVPSPVLPGARIKVVGTGFEAEKIYLTLDGTGKTTNVFGAGPTFTVWLNVATTTRIQTLKAFSRDTNLELARATIAVQKTAPPPPGPTIRAMSGYGVDVTGGDMYPEVKILGPAESGPGSWAYACQGSDRKIVLAFEGELHLPTNTAIRGRNVTVDGSKAPGKGVTFTGDTIQPSYGARNIKLVDFRHRGFGPTAVNEGDCISPTRDVAGLLIARLSLSGHNDECIGIWDRVVDVTIQDNIVGASQPAAADHNYAVLAGMYSKRISIHHNILFGGKYRNPAIGWEGDVAGGHADDLVGDVVCNVVYDFIDWGITVYNDGNGNVVKNYVQGRTRNVVEISARGQAFVQGNFSPQGFAFPVGNHARFPVPVHNQVPEEATAQDAARTILTKAGCRVGGLDAYDQALLAKIAIAA